MNSLAHFQHNNWNEKSSHKYYFYFTDQILKMIFELSKRYDSMIIYNGFSQKKIKAEYMIRPKDPKLFFKKIGIEFKNFQSNMTNGALVSFDSNIKFNKAISILKKYNIYGYNLFDFKLVKKKQIFIRVKIRSRKNLSTISSNYKSFKNDFFYEDKNKTLKKNINNKINDFIDSMVFIKTTSKHTHKGVLFYNGLHITKKKIENIKIFNFINNFFQ